MRVTTTARMPRRQLPVAHALRPGLQSRAFGLRAERGYLVVAVAGGGDITSGGELRQVDAPRLIWLPPGAAQKLSLHPGSSGEVLELPEAVLARGVPTAAFGDELRRMLAQALVLPLTDAEMRQHLAQSLAEIRAELHASEPGHLAMVEHQLTLVLIRLWRLARKQNIAAGTADRSLADRFVLLVGLHCRDHWTVEDYCRRLEIGRDRLGGICRAATGLSPQAYIHRELHRDARELLLGSEMQVSQVAFRLGFADPAYFNRFFPRMEGVSPGRLRRSIRKRDGAADGSFAAWP